MTCGRTTSRIAAIVLAMAIVGGATGVQAKDPVWDQEPKGVNPATGAPAGAPAGCCCIPKLHPTADAKLDCKPGMVEFDCKAQCAQLKDGRDPSGCTWAKGDCPH